MFQDLEEDRPSPASIAMSKICCYSHVSPLALVIKQILMAVLAGPWSPSIWDCPDVIHWLAPHGFSAGNSHVVMGVVQRDLVILGWPPPKIARGNVQAFFVAQIFLYLAMN